jgi:hypothetical protein
MDPGLDPFLNGVSKALLYASGLVGAAVIIALVFRAYFERRRVHASLVATRTATEIDTT